MKNLLKNSSAALLLSLLSVSICFSQTSVSGKVTDGADGEPLAGVNVVVKGTVLGTITNTSGEFSLTAKDSPPLTLVFSFIGYATQEISITEANSD
ncbi:MAG: carboxypeptidase-like regulatory domain-containing protein, partial [Cyclobacteriaceae bacterium]|nr:carboxypeptidase-like regulatory domain-containing protein [Cyclobacteriaceae bacterium]